MYSSYLKSQKESCLKLIELLSKDYQYVSILGTCVTGVNVNVDCRTTNILDSDESECGFVVKVYNDSHYSEYSTDVINDVFELYLKIKEKIALDSELTKNSVNVTLIEEEEICEKYERCNIGYKHSLSEIVSKVKKAVEEVKSFDKEVINARCSFATMEVSKMFLSTKKDLEQYYTYNNARLISVVRRDNKVNYYYENFEGRNEEEIFKNLFEGISRVVSLSKQLLDSTQVIPGVYDVITDPTITGLIAHEAFGHGVEMDMFVKNRARAKEYVNKEVASSLVEMHDGASAIENVSSYFFDDDGVMANDTIIIKDGILKTGISDCLSALQLKQKPTGNGRRESYKRKSYTRMTNTFFTKGESSLDEMIKSIDYGYYVSSTMNGMEDPKNWGIQCVCLYGLEIVNGKFSGKIISPAVMSGYVPDLLKSISMVSNEFSVSGGGHCGKGYKEWVCVSDGGPHLKVKVKLG